MNLLTKLAILSLVTAAAFAQSPNQVGSWSVYTSTGNVTAKNVVMLQTTATSQDRPGTTAKLDVICKNNKVVAIALETGSKLDRHVVSYTQEIPTAKVVFAVTGRVAVSETWAVADKGRTLTPYSQLLQSKLNRTWVERINGTETMDLQLGEKEALTFDTQGLAAALESASCTQ